jgi:hypothetical protein
MIVKTISATYERKHNLGDFCSANIGVTIWAELDPEDNSTEALAVLFEEAKAMVRAQLLPLVAKQKAELKEVFAGMQVSQEGAGK